MAMDEIREEIREVNGERILPEEEQLIGRFFAENTVELQDRGFTNRVMRRLPDRSVCLNRIWTAICLVAAVAVFILTKGWISILGTLQGFFTDMVTSVSPASVLSVFGTMVLLTAVAGYSLVTSER